jgi:hypothetical protein
MEEALFHGYHTSCQVLRTTLIPNVDQGRNLAFESNSKACLRDTLCLCW